MKADFFLKENWSILEAEEAADLKLIEEIFNKKNDSHPVQLYAPLEKKSKNIKTLKRLEGIERAIIAKALREGIF